MAQSPLLGLPFRRPIARSLDIVGERWAILVLRDLRFGPRKFHGFEQSLPRISPNTLSARLKRLEEARHHRAPVLRAASAARGIRADEKGQRTPPGIARPLQMGRAGRPVRGGGNIAAALLSIALML